MPLPDILEIVPPQANSSAMITVPGSKSITNRALILGALKDGETVLAGALWSEDTQVMVECLQELGFMVNVQTDPQDASNRTITIYGKSGSVPSGGTEEQPVELFVGNAGTAARFLAAFVCLGTGAYRLRGVERMHERPQAGLFQALRQLGYRVDSRNDKLPATIHGTGPKEGRCEVSIEESSQFASALLLCAAPGGWQVTVTGQDHEEAAYVTMTSKMVQAFPKSGGRFQIEPDASSGSYFLAADRLLFRPAQPKIPREGISKELEPSLAGRVAVAHWPNSGWQIDENFPKVLSRLESSFVANRSALVPSGLPTSVISRARDLGDSIMTGIVIAPLAAEPIHFADLGRLRVQECERVMALRTELTSCGAKIVERGDTLEVFPSKLHGADIETYNDHRIAMCFSILGLKVPGIRIKNPACVKKTFPNFYQKLAELPPFGLGAVILGGQTGERLGFAELFAH